MLAVLVVVTPWVGIAWRGMDWVLLGYLQNTDVNGPFYEFQMKFPEIVYYANAYADYYHVPRALVHAVITQESGWNRNARSNKGAAGLMQLLPGTAARFAVRNPTAVADNISGGVQYLALLISMFRGDLRMAVAAYYCGEHHIQHRGLNYQNPEVIAYVLAVQRLYDREIHFHQHFDH